MWEYLNLKSHSNLLTVGTRYGLVETWHLLDRFFLVLKVEKTYLGLKIMKYSETNGLFCLEVRFQSPYFFLASEP